MEKYHKFNLLFTHMQLRTYHYLLLHARTNVIDQGQIMISYNVATYVHNYGYLQSRILLHQNLLNQQVL